MPPPELPSDVVEEILARFPPHEPAHLVRAALSCKPWHRIVSGAGFRRRLHGRAPPLLGFFHHHGSHPASFNPTSPSFRPPYAARLGWLILNARHGRFLVRKMTTSPFAPPSMEDAELIVWDPTTDEQHRVPMPPFKFSTWSAALVCAAAAAAGGCDHFDCPKGPFLVVFVLTNDTEKGMISACVYSSEQGAWSEPTYVHCQRHGCWHSLRVRGPIVLVKNAVYFGCDRNTSVLEYDLGEQKLSMIGLPLMCHWRDVLLMTAEGGGGGGVGFAIVYDRKLYLCSREAGSGGGYDYTWVQQRVIELDKLLPDRGPRFGVDYHAVAIADDLGVVFIWEDYWSLFTIDLRSNIAKKVGHVGFAFGIVPYTNFYTTALREAFAGEEARAGA
ncbi:hypothetical protein HU200_015915 [Digitaria exilis]|uniref:F-box domain-containing protein n=1 Tax=Digitaria exilis TaxID=1010633 RepID=A0A835KIY2_9POAL|nr:hypothetical protein HU200_015915 [Digitaria exilis]